MFSYFLHDSGLHHHYTLLSDRRSRDREHQIFTFTKFNTVVHVISIAKTPTLLKEFLLINF